MWRDLLRAGDKGLGGNGWTSWPMRAQDGAHRISETASWPGKALKGGRKGKFVAKVRGGGLWRWLQVSVWRIGCLSVCGCLVGLGQGRAGPGIVGCTWLTVEAGKGRAVLSWQQCLYLEFWVLGLGEGGRGGSRKGSQFDFWLPSFWQDYLTTDKWTHPLMGCSLASASFWHGWNFSFTSFLGFLISKSAFMTRCCKSWSAR